VAKLDLCYDGSLSRSGWERIRDRQRPREVQAPVTSPVRSALRHLRPLENLNSFRDMVARKARLQPTYVQLLIPREWAGITGAALNARMFARLLQQRPELVRMCFGSARLFSPHEK
ncbi:MAG: hypothetical protein ACUVWX_13360, partial [Kiritimatiellia bacterium]